MQRKTPKWLYDISASAEFILREMEGKQLVDYQQNPLLRAAIERHFEIIGEAVNRLVRNDPQTAARISSHTQIIAFRNVLIHGYELIDHTQVWKVIKEHLPRLKDEVENILRGAGE
jgi:uncharacterized protein with HEPN domain